jgi:hypothetical protein
MVARLPSFFKADAPLSSGKRLSRKAERGQLIQERKEAQKLFQKLIEQDRQQEKPKGGGRGR